MQVVIHCVPTSSEFTFKRTLSTSSRWGKTPLSNDKVFYLYKENENGYICIFG